ncbi:MAG: STAS domain-containing protein [Chromatiaceae bacterium]
MDITHSQQGAIRIIELKGRMDAVTAPLFDKAFAEVATPDASDFIIQLSGLEYISSAGLRSILMVAKQVKARSGRLILTGLTDEVREVFHLSGFHTILRICDAKEDALAELA